MAGENALVCSLGSRSISGDRRRCAPHGLSRRSNMRSSMAKPHLVVTHKPGSKEQKLLGEWLGELVQLTFIKGLAPKNRDGTLAKADI